MVNRIKDKKIKNIITVSGSLILLFLFIKHFLVKTEFIFDVIASVLILIIFHKFYNKLHQDCMSYFFLMLALTLHNLGIYATTPLGIRFDHYMHFVGGFTIAIIGDRLFYEKFKKLKKFILLILFALGVGAIGEVIEWAGYGILGEGEGFFFYGIGDEGEWRNAMLDLMFNSFGATLMATITLFGKWIKQ